MSNYMMKAIHKSTGENKEVICLDDHFGKHKYGYMVGEYIHNQEEFYKYYEALSD